MKITENFEYPLMPEWSTEEIITASEFYEAVEKVYTSGIAQTEFLEKYERFLKMEPAIMAQKQLDREFKQASGLSLYQTVKYVKESQKKYIKYS